MYLVAEIIQEEYEREKTGGQTPDGGHYLDTLEKAKSMKRLESNSGKERKRAQSKLYPKPRDIRV